LEKRYQFRDQQGRCTTFFQSGDAIWLAELCGLDCGMRPSIPLGEPIPALVALEFDEDYSIGNDFHLMYSQVVDELSFEANWTVGKAELQWHSLWTLEPITGVWSRQDRLVNPGEKISRISKALPRFYFPQNKIELYVQKSTWAHENQGEWIGVVSAEQTLKSLAGRTNQGASPYLFVREQARDTGIAFHLLPQGNWIIHLSSTRRDNPPSNLHTFIELGLSNEGLQVDLKPGETFELPEILIQPVSPGQPEAGAAGIHRYILDRYFSRWTGNGQKGIKPFAPLLYNTWFDSFENLNLERLRFQLQAAREIGCEIFVVDAGWYGNGQGPWDRQVGDWSEKRQAAFKGHMSEFADEVRQAGLGFGLWMEPERLAASSPVLSSHPDWFLPCPYDYFRFDLVQQAAGNFLLDEISRLVETYKLAWMKIDFNLEMGREADGLAGYYQAWYELLGRLRSRFPDIFFEGCASGGMRLDLNTLRHFDGHFLSDTVNPVDMLRITQGALLRVPAGRLTRWAVLRSGEWPDQVIAPEGANWDKAFVADVDFICRAALPGMFGYSGDLAGLSSQIKQRLRQHSEFYKNWREFMTWSICHLLTPVENIKVRNGWVAFQFQQPGEEAPQLIFVYRLDDDSPQKNIPLRNLEPRQAYHITNIDFPQANAGVFWGKELMEQGIAVELLTKFSAGIWVMRSIK
jgi:alpha-galactosidase